MGIAGSFTATVVSTSATLPASGLTVIGATVHTADTTGTLSIPVDGSRNAIFGFRPTTATTTATAGGKFQNNEWHFHMTVKGTTLNFTGTGLTNGTFIFYYGTPFPDSKPLADYTAVSTSYTTGATVTMTFSADVILTGVINVLGTAAGETNLYVIDTWASGTGVSVTLAFAQGEPLHIRPLEGMTSAASLVVTQTYDGTATATGFLIFYYRFK